MGNGYVVQNYAPDAEVYNRWLAPIKPIYFYIECAVNWFWMFPIISLFLPISESSHHFHSPSSHYFSLYHLTISTMPHHLTISPISSHHLLAIISPCTLHIITETQSLFIQDWLSPNPIFAPTHLPTRPEAKTYTFHTLHTYLSSHTHLQHVICTIHNTWTTCTTYILTPWTHVTLALSQNTHIPYKQQHTHQSPPHSPHRVPRQLHRQTKDNHMTTHTTQTQQ